MKNNTVLGCGCLHLDWTYPVILADISISIDPIPISTVATEVPTSVGEIRIFSFLNIPDGVVVMRLKTTR